MAVRPFDRDQHALVAIYHRHLRHDDALLRMSLRR